MILPRCPFLVCGTCSGKREMKSWECNMCEASYDLWLYNLLGFLASLRHFFFLFRIRVLFEWRNWLMPPAGFLDVLISRLVGDFIWKMKIYMVMVWLVGRLYKGSENLSLCILIFSFCLSWFNNRAVVEFLSGGKKNFLIRFEN